MLHRNLGITDRLIRLATGAVLLGGGVLADGAWRWMAVVGTVLILTAAIRFCPAYRLLGIRTCVRTREGLTTDRHLAG